MDTELEELEVEFTEELAALIGEFTEHKAASAIKDAQPPESIILAMAKAAAQVLIAFECGYRMDGES